MNERKYFKKLALPFAVLALTLTASLSFGAETSLPRSYDLRQKGWMAPIRQQHPDGKPFGTCWSMSSVAAVESSLISKGLMRNTDSLSVWYQVYYTYNDEAKYLPAFDSYQKEYYNDGGTTFRIMAIFARGTGPVFES
ncbi:MAG: C1 family peptidase, partial [Synergistaceae bacterium]|nr:C1 family peptidase [Synergistaceae bacterium]